MADLHVKIDIRITPRIAHWGLVGMLVAMASTELSSESVTLTTYYPAPSGIYAKMITTEDTFLARDTGSVVIGTIATPIQKLEVAGNIGLTGYIRFNANCGAPEPYIFGDPTPVWTFCPAGRYATYAPGMYSNDVMGPTAAGGDAQGGFMYCCPR